MVKIFMYIHDHSALVILVVFLIVLAGINAYLFSEVMTLRHDLRHMQNRLNDWNEVDLKETIGATRSRYFVKFKKPIENDARH